MPTPISALEHTPVDFVREVSPEAITFYVDELSGIYLPGEFKAEHAAAFDVKYWKPEDRLRGKFGRFALEHDEESNSTESLDDILVMGTTIGLGELDREGYMRSLRHFNLSDVVRGILEQRDLLGKPIRVNRADFGATAIQLAENGTPKTLSVDSSSIDFGRATEEGRQRTCEMFTELLGGTIDILNDEPAPRQHDRIVD